jgi:hypothetical protein
LLSETTAYQFDGVKNCAYKSTRLRNTHARPPGASLQVIAMLLGEAKLSTAAIYSHVSVGLGINTNVASEAVQAIAGENR